MPEQGLHPSLPCSRNVCCENKNGQSIKLQRWVSERADSEEMQFSIENAQLQINGADVHVKLASL